MHHSTRRSCNLGQRMSFSRHNASNQSRLRPSQVNMPSYPSANSMNKSSVYGGGQLAYPNSNMVNQPGPGSLYTSSPAYEDTNSRNGDISQNAFYTSRTGNHPNALPPQQHQSQQGWASYAQTPTMQKVNQNYQSQKSETSSQPQQQNSYTNSTQSPLTYQQQQAVIESPQFQAHLANIQMNMANYQQQSQNPGMGQGMMGQNFQNGNGMSSMGMGNNYSPSMKNGGGNSMYNSSPTQNPLTQCTRFQQHQSDMANRNGNENFDGQEEMSNGGYNMSSRPSQPQSMPMSVGNYQALNSVRQQQNMLQNPGMQQQQQMNAVYQNNKSPYVKTPQSSSMQQMNSSQLNNLYNNQNQIMYSQMNGGRQAQTGVNSGSQMYGGQYRPLTSGMNNYQQQMMAPSSGQPQMSQSSQMRQMNSRAPLTPAQMRAAQMSGQFNSMSGSNQMRQQSINSDMMTTTNNTNPGQGQGQGQGQMSQQTQNIQIPQLQTIRVGVPPPGGVLEPQTIRVRAPTPQPVQSEPPMLKVGLGGPQGGYSESTQGDVGDASESGGGMDDGAGKVKYIPMSWGELLGGGGGGGAGGPKDSLNGLKVIMAAPPSSDAPNQNRQLRVAFGNQTAVAQPGEVPLKVVSINPVEGYKMGPVTGLNQGDEDQQQQIEAAPTSSPNRTQSQSLSGSSLGRQKNSSQPSPNNMRVGNQMAMMANQGRGQSSSMYTGSANNNNNSSIVRRIDFAGTKYY